MVLDSKFLYKKKTGKKIVAAKYLGRDDLTKSWELVIPIKHPNEHNGEINGNYGRIGYCVYTNPERIIKKLTKKEMFVELL